MLELLVSDLRPVLQDILTYAVLGAALFWGAGPERATIGAWIVCFELPKQLYKLAWGTSFQFQSIDPFLASPRTGYPVRASRQASAVETTLRNASRTASAFTPKATLVIGPSGAGAVLPTLSPSVITCNAVSR